MDRMLVVVFDNESKAYEGKKALLQLDGEGSIGVYGYAVLARNADGGASVKQGDDVGPIGSLVGTLAERRECADRVRRRGVLSRQACGRLLYAGRPARRFVGGTSDWPLLFASYGCGRDLAAPE